MPKDLITCKQAGQYLGLSVSTLAKWRCYRVPDKPPWHEFGTAVRYREEELDAWVLSKRHEALSGGILTDA